MRPSFTKRCTSGDDTPFRTNAVPAVTIAARLTRDPAPASWMVVGATKPAPSVVVTPLSVAMANCWNPFSKATGVAIVVSLPIAICCVLMPPPASIVPVIPVTGVAVPS